MKQVRSTLLQSSLASLRVVGQYERYLERLEAPHREQIVGAIAPTWLPIELGEAHYRACQALELTPEQLLAVGESVGDRIQGGFLETLTRAARSIGVTPWVLFNRSDALWSRLFRGGSIELTRVGPKDLTIDIQQARLTQTEYFRSAFCGVVRAGFKYVGVRAASVRVTQWVPATDRFTMRAAWV